MAKKEYAFYPGCSSQLRGSASNYLTSVNSMCKTLDVKLTQIPDWNCCGASIGYAESGELPRHVMNARNFALAEKHLPGQDVVATCAACWLNAKESKEKLAAQCGARNGRQRGAEGSRPAISGQARPFVTWSKC